jgi:hypothetical protein
LAVDLREAADSGTTDPLALKARIEAARKGTR